MNINKTVHKMYLFLLLIVLYQKNLIAMQEALRMGYNLPKSSSKTIKLAQALIKIQKEEAKKCFELAIILDDHRLETPNSKWQTVNDDFSEALKRKKFPIIVSNGIVWNICDPYYSSRPPSKPDPIDDDWYCYDHPQAKVMLFVPKDYVKNFGDLYQEDHSLMKLCGFDTTNLIKMEKLTARSLMYYFCDNKYFQIVDNQQAILPTVKGIESMFIIPTKPNAPTWNILSVGHGGSNLSVAGLGINDFFELLQIFQKINCSILCYNTCETGGRNLIQVTEVLEKLKANFIVVTQGINENSVVTTFRGNFEEFFPISEVFFGNPNRFVQTKKQFALKDPIASMIRPLINNTSALMLKQSFVYMPAVGIFNAIAVDKQVKIITNASLKSYAFENQIIDCTHPAVNAIMVYPTYVDRTMKIGSSKPYIVSPTTPKSKNMDLHIFEEIVYGDTLSQFLYKCLLCLNLKYWPVTFIIKKLQCLNSSNLELKNKDSQSIFLENVIVHCGGLNNENDISIATILDCNNKNYAIEPHVIKYDYSLSSDFPNMCFKFAKNNINFIAISESDEDANLIDLMPSYLQQLISTQNILNTEDTYITLTDITNALESYTDKATLVQEPESLKNILLKQKEAVQKKILQEKK